MTGTDAKILATEVGRRRMQVYLLRRAIELAITYAIADGVAPDSSALRVLREALTDYGRDLVTLDAGTAPLSNAASTSANSHASDAGTLPASD